MGEEQEKFKLLNGLLHFRLQSEFNPRLWEAKRSLRDLDKTLEKTKKTKRNLVRAANNAPKYFESYGNKIKWSRQRIQILLSRLDSAIRQQERYIQQLALFNLTQRRRNLENYHVRARFGIARLFDSLVIEKEKKEEVQDAKE
jgi:hypothetical protein